MGYLPCLCSSPLGCAGSSDTALLSPQQERQLTHRGKLTLKKKKQRESWEMFRAPSLQQEQGVLPPSPSLAVTGEGLGWGSPAGAPCPSRSPAQGRDWALTSRKSCPEVPRCAGLAGEALSWELGQAGTPGLCPGHRAQLGKSQPRKPSTSVSSLSGPSTEQRVQQQKKCKMHLKILFHFPFCQKQKCLNNRGQKQLLQNFQELGKIKSPVRRTGFRRFPPRPGQSGSPRAELLP